MGTILQEEKFKKRKQEVVRVSKKRMKAQKEKQKKLDKLTVKTKSSYMTNI